MKRVLQIGLSGNLGGIETFLVNVNNMIDYEKIKFEFLVFGNEKVCFEDQIIASGGIIHRINTIRNKNPFKYYKEVRTFFEEKHKFDIIHFHCNTLSGAEIILIAKKHINKCIIHSHNVWRGKSLQTKLMHNINKILIKNKVDLRLACSNDAGKFMFDKDDFTLVKNGIDSSKFKFNEHIRSKVRNEFNITDKEVIIGNVGRFTYQKNHERIIEIFCILYKENIKYKLMLIGTGELFEYIKKKVEVLGIEDRVIFTGVRYDINELLMGMDIFLLPSFFEGFPVALIESQASGLKSLVSKESVNEDMNIVEQVDYISLQAVNKDWIEVIKREETKIDRCKFSELIMKSGYDSKKTVEFLTKLYTSI